MDINLGQMKELIDVLENSTLTEISIEEEGYKITLKKDYAGGKKHSDSDNTVVSTAKKDKSSQSINEKNKNQITNREDNLIPVTSPIVGTFFRTPSPESPPYVEIGDKVESEDTICIVEAMKVMNEVKAGSNGIVEEVFVEDGEPVEYGETLFLLKPINKNSEKN